MKSTETGFDFVKFKPVINQETKEVSFVVIGSADEYDVFKYSNSAIRNRQKDGLKNNPASIDFYKELDTIERLYPPYKFKRVKGDIYGKGNKFGHIICTRDISPNIKEHLENFKLKRKGQPAEYYELERYFSIDDVPDRVLAEITRMISRNYATEE